MSNSTNEETHSIKSSKDNNNLESALPDLNHKEDVSSNVQPARQFGVTSAIFLIVNKIIGAGIFSSPSSVLKNSGSVGMALMLWLIAGVISTCGSIMMLELGTGVPVSGGIKNYFERSIPSRPLAATCFYVFYCIILQVSTPNAITFSNYVLLAAGTDSTTWKMRGVAIAGIVFSVALFAFLPKTAMRINNLLGIVKVIMLLFVIFTGFAALGGHVKTEIPNNFNTKTLFNDTKANVYDISSALISATFSYHGFDNANAILSEIKNPVRSLKIAMPIAMGIVTILNILANVAYFSGVSIEQFHSSGITVAGSLFQNVFGKNAGTKALPALVSLSALGHLIGLAKTIPVLIQELAKQDVLIFNDIFTSNKPFGTPLAALTLHCIVTIIFICGPPAGEAFDFVLHLGSYTNNFMYMLCAIVVVKLRYFDKNWTPPFRSPIPLVVFFILCSAFMFVSVYIPPSTKSGGIPYYLSYVVSLSIVFLGIPYYLIRFIILPKVLGYVLIPKHSNLSDGSHITRYKRVKKD